ncbi:Ion transport protein-domain-containing protein [Haematococcus lacustris]
MGYASAPETLVSGELEQEPPASTLWGRIRHLAKLACTHEDFETLVLLAVLGNCVTLSAHDPLLGDKEGRNHGLFWADAAFNFLFTIELVLKVVAETPAVYVKDPWNVFDALLVGIGYTQFIPSDSGNTAGMRALRALRALRPLRTISRFPALKDVTETLFQALPLLGAVAALLAFHLYFFSTLGVALFSDAYHKACYDPTTDSLEPGGDDPDIFSCSRWRQCPAGTGQCTWFDESLATNVAGWSNFGTGLLTVFQCITLTGWNYVMYRSMDSVSPIAAVPFYISLVFIGQCQHQPHPGCGQ